VLYPVWNRWLNEYGKELKIGDGTNKTFHLVMAIWDNEEDGPDNRKVAMKKKSSGSSVKEDDNSNNGCCSIRDGIRVRGTWRDIKSRYSVESFLVREEHNSKG